MNRLSRFKRFIYQRHGVAAVEFAIVLPLLILVGFGAIEFGLMIYNQQVITNACREGARAGIVYREPRVTEEEIKGVVKYYAENHLVTFSNPADPNINVSMYDSNNNPLPDGQEAVYRDKLNVTVKYKYNFLVMPNFIPGLDKEITLTAQAIMMIE